MEKMNLPDVELLGLNEEKETMSSLIKEDKLNLVLFYNSGCLGCTGRAIPLAYDLSQEFDFIELIVIHSNFRPAPFTSEEVLQEFRDNKSPFNIYREEKNELFKHFECEGTPHWLIMNDKGEVLHSFFGSQERSQMKLEYAIREFA